MKNSLETRREWLRRKWGNFRFFVYTIFHRRSRFQNWEVNDVVVLKPTRKKMIISGNVINSDKGGGILIKGDEK